MDMNSLIHQWNYCKVYHQKKWYIDRNSNRFDDFVMQ